MMKLTEAQNVFFEVATLNDPAAEPFAVMRIDASKPAGHSLEANVVSVHWTRPEAEERAAAMRAMERK